MSESVGKTISVAGLLCGACSILVAGAVVALRPMQKKNKELDFKKNILQAAGLMEKNVDVEQAFQKIESVVVNLNTGEITDMNPNQFVQEKADKNPDYLESIAKKNDAAGIKKRSKFQKVYFVKDSGQVSQIILHVYGKGLWSTMKGFLALAPDTKTVKGFNYYSHGETPGLGGEVDNPKWKAQWKGKEVYNDDYEPAIQVVKGSVSAGAQNAEYKVDGLSGATLTSNGVEGTFEFWMSENGYGKFLANFRNGGIQ